MDLLGILEPFAGPIGDAARVYPVIAVLASFPLAALFLVLLPLPELPARGAESAAWEARFGRLRRPELDPTSCLSDIFAAQTGTQRARALFQALFNLALLAPLGA
jgi:hypothetical protein